METGFDGPRPSPDRRSVGRHVGDAVPRTDAPEKVTGDATYTADLSFADLDHAALVMSPIPHGRIRSIDADAAEALPGVRGVVTAADVPDVRRGQYILDRPILPADRVRYAGEPVAVVVATTREAAERAAALVDVDYEPLDAVFDLDEAFRRDPPARVHDDVRGYEFRNKGRTRYERSGHVTGPDAERPNLLYRDDGHVGDVERGFRHADRIVEGEYAVDAFQHCAMELKTVVARVERDSLSLWSSTQVPHAVEKEVCEAYPEFAAADVSVRAPFVGGGFGGRVTAYLELILVAAARKFPGTPIKLRFRRAEEFTSGINRPQVVTHITDGVAADGSLLARDVTVTFNVGAYNEQAFRYVCSGPSVVVGSYSIPNVRWRSYGVYTNRPVAGAFRGYGKPEVNWAVERQMDAVARELDVNPLAVRDRNVIPPGGRTATGESIGTGDTRGCLHRSFDRIRDRDGVPDRYRADHWRLGVGCAYGNKPGGTALAPATVRIHRGTYVEVSVGAPDIGQGSDTVFAQIAADEFGVGLDHVRLVAGDTARTPYNRGPTGSRFTFHTGNAVRKAAADAKGTLFALAVERLDGDYAAADLATADGDVFVRERPSVSIPVDDLFTDYDHETGASDTVVEGVGELIGTATYDSRPMGDHSFWTPVGQAARVAVDTLTGRVDVLEFCTACDVGRALNPAVVEQQLEGAAAQGIASALYEGIVYDGGRTTNPNFKEYRIPGPTELPYHNTTVVLESADEDGPYGARGVGEMGMIAAAPAVGNAVADALGVAPNEIPITPERVVALLED